MKLKYFFYLLIATSFLTAKADNLKLKRAEKLYSAYAFKEAIPLYLDLIKQNTESETCIKRLANSYRLINDMPNAEKWYQELTQKFNYTADDAYYYSMALRENGKDAEADTWMKKFNEKKQGDSRSIEFSTQKEAVKKWMSMKDNYQIKNMEFNTNGIEFSPSYVSNDEIMFVAARNSELMIKHEFSWNQTPFLDIYTINLGVTNRPVTLKGKVNSKFHDGPACLSRDKKTIYFTRNNYDNKKKETSSDGVLKLKLYTAQVNEKGAWENIKELTFDNKEYSVGHPAINKEENRLYFTSDMPGSIGGTDIWYSDKKSDGTWDAPKNAGPVINTEGNEMFPFVADNGSLFFASSGHYGLGGLDIFYSATNNGEFKKINNLGAGINSVKDDFGIIISADMKTGYFSSNREEGRGDDDIYAVSFLKSFATPFILKGKITDEQSKNGMENVKVFFKNAGKETELITNDKGEYEIEVEELSNAELIVRSDKYFDVVKSNITHDFNENNPVCNIDIPLIKKEGYVLAGIIADNKSNTPLQGVKITFDGNGEVKTFNTGAEGKINVPLTGKKPGDIISYKVKIEKEGYLSKDLTLTKTLDKPGEISINELLNNVNLEKLEVGVDIGKLLDIKPIYFDLGKFAIRKDGAKELDKIVKAMVEHPNMVIELGSHTDCRGSAKSNEELSDKRAKASAAYVVAKGINSSRIYGKGYGESKLANGCACESVVKSKCTEAEHQENRRTEFIIVKLD